MRKIVSIALVIVLLMIGLIILTGCGNNVNNENETGSENESEIVEQNNGYSKQVENYTVKSSDETAEVSFELTAEDNFSQSSALGGGLELRNEVAKIEVRLLHDSALSSQIHKEEKDFYADKYHDYKEVTVGNYTGWEVYVDESEYKSVLVLSEKEEDTNKVYALSMTVSREDKSVDLNGFINSEDFQHLLDTVNLTINE